MVDRSCGLRMLTRLGGTGTIGEPPVLDVVTWKAYRPTRYVEQEQPAQYGEHRHPRGHMAPRPRSDRPFKALTYCRRCTETADPFGLTANKAIRIRGSAFHLGQTIEGLPLTGVVGGATSMIWKTWTASPLRGAVPVKGFGFQRHRANRPDHSWPLDAGVQRQGKLCSYGFNRVYGRIDSGLLPTDTKLFASYSYTTVYNGAGPGSRPLIGTTSLRFTQKRRIPPSSRFSAPTTIPNRTISAPELQSSHPSRRVRKLQQAAFRHPRSGHQLLRFQPKRILRLQPVRQPGNQTRYVQISVKPYYWRRRLPAVASNNLLAARASPLGYRARTSGTGRAVRHCRRASGDFGLLVAGHGIAVSPSVGQRLTASSFGRPGLCRLVGAVQTGKSRIP